MNIFHRLHLAWHRFQEWRFIRHAERTTGLKVGEWTHDPDRDYGLTVTGEWTKAEPFEVIGTAQPGREA